ncbi:MAG: hypothetical protein J7515_15600 [Caulobacter sp.]|nr:hypothetical protein [Caulobacter sp.]
MIRLAAVLILASAGLAGCATRESYAQPSYLQMAMTVGKNPQGRLTLSTGVADPLTGDRVRLQRQEMRLPACGWSEPRTITVGTGDVGLVTVVEDGVMKGPKALSREFSAEFDRLVAARGLHPTPQETACAHRLLDTLASSEDAN